ncbi:ATP-binding protein [Micromonospora sp. CA-249363]|uniref:ATP-binding protein n=1 Tax=Micromonospora sp. CA-249363 TaxID=3239963 RepID=UPI003D91824D
MRVPENTVGIQLDHVGIQRESIPVRLSKELITLLSEQLYQSPLKAIEELVVNSFDAEAAECRIFVPIVAAGTAAAAIPLMLVFDNGIGMDMSGLVDLWRIGSSTKREERITRIRKRRQIGKFGIGKLATYALANRITYVTSSGDGEILALSLLYSDFRSEPGLPDRPTELTVRQLTEAETLALPNLRRAASEAGLEAQVALKPNKTWTIVLLEGLKAQGRSISPGRLRWVLRTAMPITQEFRLFLNGEEVTSSKLDYETIAEFNISDLPPERLKQLEEKTGIEWSATSDGLRSSLFPNKISGQVVVTKKSLYEGKSADLTRSHGFFVRVRGRLIDEDNALAGVAPRAYEVFYRFRADVNADDLDSEITAAREAVGLSPRRTALTSVLTEVLNEARTRYEKVVNDRHQKQANKNEPDRNYVPPRHVEMPVADVLATNQENGADPGTDADEGWFYLRPPTDTSVLDLITKLYETETRNPYEYSIESLGPGGRLVQFHPDVRRFVLNEDHILFISFGDDPRALDLLKDFATAEALLEIYLRGANVSPHLIGEILERRDLLMRSLAREQINSPAAIAASLRDAVSSERDLEVAVIIAARALGFVAKHLSGSERPDGVARFRDHAVGDRKIILEAKSSVHVPSLGAIDFGGLHQHVNDEKADGCLLVAPDYPGSSREDDSAASKRAEALRISCWTVEQLARVVECMDKRDITARDILRIVESAFTPASVAAAVDALLADPTHPSQAVAGAILRALRELDRLVPHRTRSLDMLIPEIARQGIDPINAVRVEEALRALAAASRGALTIMKNDRIQLNTAVEELERRVNPWLRNLATSRRESTFRSSAL